MCTNPQYGPSTLHGRVCNTTCLNKTYIPSIMHTTSDIGRYRERKSGKSKHTHTAYLLFINLICAISYARVYAHHLKANKSKVYYGLHFWLASRQPTRTRAPRCIC